MGGGMGGMGGIGMQGEYIIGVGGEYESIGEREARASFRAQALITLIQESIDPDSWYDVGGEGTITTHDNRRLIVLQTREVHNKINKLLKELGKTLKEEVSIEARFLLVSENFIESIGLDIGFTLSNTGKFDVVTFEQDSIGAARPTSTGDTASLAGAMGARLSGVWGSILDDLEVTFLLEATQAHRDATSLTSPKVTVLSGESAILQVQKTIQYALPPVVSARDIVGGVSGISSSTSFQPQRGLTRSGTTLSVTPIVMPDKKHVLLHITATLQGYFGLKDFTVDTLVPDTGEIVPFKMSLPETEISRVRTRVSIPDGGTLLLGGQKVTEEVEREAGVPVLSKIPIIGRIFSNRSKIKDSKILLILVKPTIILQEEVDAEAIAALEMGL